MKFNKNKIEKIYYAPFVRKFKRGTNAKKISSNIRCGYIIKAKIGERYAYGEASPIEPHSTDNLNEIKYFLQKNNKEDLIKNWNSKQKLPASIKMAIDSIEYDFENIVDLRTNVKISALLNITTIEQTQESFLQLWEKGFRCFKIKINPKNKDLCIETIKTIRKLKSQEAIIRLDSNQCFRVKEALQTAQKIQKYEIEFWEDPIDLAQSDQYFYFKKNCSIPLAADQGLNSIENLKLLLENDWAEYYILKPTCLGGIYECKHAISLIKEKKKKYIITSALESEIGLRAIQRLSLEHPSHLSYGLATIDLFEQAHMNSIAKISKVETATDSEATWLNNLEWQSL